MFHLQELPLAEEKPDEEEIARLEEENEAKKARFESDTQNILEQTDSAAAAAVPGSTEPRADPPAPPEQSAPPLEDQDAGDGL